MAEPMTPREAVDRLMAAVPLNWHAQRIDLEVPGSIELHGPRGISVRIEGRVVEDIEDIIKRLPS